jgi:hypothetical protein
VIALLLLGCGRTDPDPAGHTGRSCDSAEPVDFTAEQFAASLTGPYQATLSWDDDEPDTVLTIQLNPGLDTAQNTECDSIWELFPSSAALTTEDGRLDGTFTSGTVRGGALGDAWFSGNSDDAGVWAPRTVHVDLHVLPDGSTTGEIFAFYGDDGQTASW